MKTAIILGTRPEIIKMSPVIRECERRRLGIACNTAGRGSLTWTGITTEIVNFAGRISNLIKTRIYTDEHGF